MKKRLSFRARILIFFFVVTSVPIFIFAYISQQRFIQAVEEEQTLEVESNLEKADLCVDLILEKYTTIADSIVYDEAFIEHTKDLQNNGELWITEYFKYLCLRNEALMGIAYYDGANEVLFYDKITDSTEKSSYISEMEILEPEKRESFSVYKQPVSTNEGEKYLLQISRKVLHSSIVLSIDASELDAALGTRSNANTYLCANQMVVGTTSEVTRGLLIEEIPIENRRITQKLNETTGFFLYNYHSNKEMENQLANQLFVWVIITFLAELVLLLLLYFAMLPVTKWLKGLNEEMNRVIHNDFSANMEVHSSDTVEMAQISEAFNEAVLTTKNLIEEVKQATADQKNAEISALEAQIDPHFLYNTLDTINWKAIELEQYEVSEMVGALADILRYSVRNAGEEVSLSQEIAWLEQYLLLQGSKLGGKLSTEIIVNEDVRRSRIHKLLLQPFVENALKHGFRKKKEDCQLTIEVERQEEKLHLKIKDNGIGLSQVQLEKLNEKNYTKEQIGIGIDNVRKRLDLYYGDQAKVVFESREGSYTIAHLYIPYKTKR